MSRVIDPWADPPNVECVELLRRLGPPCERPTDWVDRLTLRERVLIANATKVDALHAYGGESYGIGEGPYHDAYRELRGLLEKYGYAATSDPADLVIAQLQQEYAPLSRWSVRSMLDSAGFSPEDVECALAICDVLEVDGVSARG